MPELEGLSCSTAGHGLRRWEKRGLQMSQHTHGEMDISYQKGLFGAFVRFTVRVCVVISAVLALMALFLA